MSSTSADGLDEPSRVFYERAKFKLSLSLFLAALAMMFLGIAGQSGGRSRANQYLSDQSNLSDDMVEPYEDLVAGFGFACFAHLAGFIIAVSAAIYVSPLLSSTNEKLTIAKPQNFKFADTQSTESYGGVRGPSLGPEASAPPLDAKRKSDTPNFATVNPNAQSA